MGIQGTQQSAGRHAQTILDAYKRTEKQSIVLFSLAMLLLIIVLFFIVITLFSKNLAAQSVLTSIATSLAASLVLTLLYAWVVERARSQSESQARSLEIEETRQIVADEIEAMRQIVSEIVKTSTTELSHKIEGRINKMLEEEVTRLVTTWPELLPKEYFPPSEESNPYFRQKLGEAVQKTQQYSFRGATARFVPTLLLEHAKADLTCNILIVDPRATIPLQIYALNRFAMREADKTLADYMERVRQEIYVALVKLFDLRQRFRIEVRLCHDNLFYRSEMVEDGVFVSFYLEDRHIYPPTYFYTRKNGAFYYSAFHKDFQQSWGVAVERFPIHAAMRQNELEDFLVKIEAGNEDTIADQIKTWRSSLP
jgi:hypothetical protein